MRFAPEARAAFLTATASLLLLNSTAIAYVVVPTATAAVARRYRAASSARFAVSSSASSLSRGYNSRRPSTLAAFVRTSGGINDVFVNRGRHRTNTGPVMSSSSSSTSSSSLTLRGGDTALHASVATSTSVETETTPSQPREVYRADYRPLPFVTKYVRMNFDIRDGRTFVDTEMMIYPNQDGDVGGERRGWRASFVNIIFFFFSPPPFYLVRLSLPPSLSSFDSP